MLKITGNQVLFIIVYYIVAGVWRLRSEAKCRRDAELIVVHMRAYGETGRRAGFRFQWGNPSEFKSLYAHQNSQFFNILDSCADMTGLVAPGLI